MPVYESDYWAASEVTTFMVRRRRRPRLTSEVPGPIQLGGSGGRTEPLVLRATGAIVVAGALITTAVVVAAVTTPTLFQGGVIRRPPGPLTAGDALNLAVARVTARAAAQATGLKVAAAFGALTAGVLAWGRMELGRAERALERLANFSQRYTQAVEELGGGRSVQLGGIYALERLGIESVDHRQAVIEVLSAFVREQGGIVDRGRSQLASVQAALKVLNRVSRWWSMTQLDLRGADLTRVELSGAELPGAALAGARLVEAHLSGAGLAGADLAGADLAGAHMSRTDLSGADLSDACLSGAGLFQAKLVRAHLAGADLSGTLLAGADLSGADLSGAELNGAILLGARSYRETVWPPDMSLAATRPSG